MNTEVVTNIVVPGRAHILLPDGSLGLSPSSVARVETAAAYFTENQQAFQEQDGRIRFESGWAEAAAGTPKPPEEQREGRLMYDLGGELGIPMRFRSAGIWSRTSMENMMHPKAQFKDVARLAIVTQLSQAERFLYCGSKVFPRTELSIIEAPGETDPAIIADEERLLRQSRILYGWAGHNMDLLHIADRCGVYLGKLVGLRPGARYATAFEN